MIRLNVGGKRFETSRTTLTRCDGYFKNLLEIPGSGWIYRHFVDRSPEHFDTVLNFMRDDRVILPESLRDLEMLLIEAEFYKLKKLIEDCKRELARRNGLPFYETIPTDPASVKQGNNNNNNQVEVGTMSKIISVAKKPIDYFNALVENFVLLENSRELPDDKAWLLLFGFLLIFILLTSLYSIKK